MLMPPLRRKHCSKRINLSAVSILKNGGVGVLPTDTLYGVVASALIKNAVARLYLLRRKTSSKPFIVLIADTAMLRRFGVQLEELEQQFLKKVWPGPVSVILTVPSNRFAYLHKGKKTLAFRIPAQSGFRAFLKKTGPLLAPSANPEGLPPATTIRDAKAYFGDKVDFYVASKQRLSGLPSTLVSLKGGSVRVLRKGSGKI